MINVIANRNVPKGKAFMGVDLGHPDGDQSVVAVHNVGGDPANAADNRRRILVSIAIPCIFIGIWFVFIGIVIGLCQLVGLLP